MQNELLLGIIAGLGGMFGWGLADFFAKKTIDEIGDVASLAWGHVFGTAVLILYILHRAILSGHTVSVPNGLNIWLLLIFFGVLQAIVYLLVYNGFGKGQIAILNPIFASFSGLVAIVSVVFFGEVVSGHLIFGLITLLVGILLISTDFVALKQRRSGFGQVPGFKEVALATLLATVWTLSWDKFIGGQDWASYALFMYVFMTLSILIYAKYRKISLKVSRGAVWKFLFLIGFCETIAYLSISMGYSSTHFTSVVALLSGAFSLPTIVLAKVFLKEKITKVQTVGSLVIILGIMILAMLQ